MSATDELIIDLTVQGCRAVLLILPTPGPRSDATVPGRPRTNTRDLRHADFDEAVTWCFEVV